MAEVLLPPDICPESETIELVDDGSSVFSPAQGRSVMQVQQDYEPRLRVVQRFRALRGSDRARMIAALRRVSGKYGTIRAQIGRVLRGSFPATELLTNNTFADGTTGWTANAGGSLSVADRVMRLTATQANNASFYQLSANTQYATYVLRSMILEGSQPSGLSIGPLLDLGIGITNDYSTTRGLRTASGVVLTGTSIQNYPVLFASATGFTAGAYVDCPYTSLSRCFLVDNGANLLTYSDQFDNAAWIISGLGTASVSSNAFAAPDGTSTADVVFENTATSTHGIEHAVVTVSSAAADYSFGVAVRAGQPWVMLQILEGTAGEALTEYFQLSGAGAVGSAGATGANWGNRRAYIKNVGNGWYVCYLIGRKTNAATTLTPRIFGADSDGGVIYLGVAANPWAALWRATLSQSSVPTRLVQTTSAAVAATAQTGSALYVKGLPASTSGLLTADDVVEINGEFIQLTASLDSDAAGLGYLQFSPSLFRSPADNDPVIVNAPMPKLKLVENPKWSNEWGVQSDLELTLEQFYE